MNFRPDESMAGLMNLIREEKEAPAPTKRPKNKPEQTMEPNATHDSKKQAEEFDLESYEEEDLTTVKSKTKGTDMDVRKVKDSEVENPKPAKENRRHELYFCENCSRTFRNSEPSCVYCFSNIVERAGGRTRRRVQKQKVTEGVLELAGEIEGMSPRDTQAVRNAVSRGVIPNEWPTEDVMIEELSRLEDIVDPSEEDPDEDIRSLYMRHVLVPKAISVAEGKKRRPFRRKRIEEGEDNTFHFEPRLSMVSAYQSGSDEPVEVNQVVGKFSFDIDYRDWGIKDIEVVFQSLQVDQVDVDPSMIKIDWVPGKHLYPASVTLEMSGGKVVSATVTVEYIQF